VKVLGEISQRFGNDHRHLLQDPAPAAYVASQAVWRRCGGLKDGQLTVETWLYSW